MALTAHLTLDCTDGIAAGLKTIYIIDVDDLTSMTLASGSTSEYDTITLLTAKHFWTFDFEEDMAEFRESLEGERGSYKVTHEVEFFVKGLAEAKRDALQELISNSPCGFVVVAKDANDVHWVVGYSEEWLKERPARISGLENTTLKALAEIPGATVTLQSIDTDLARFTSATMVIA